MVRGCTPARALCAAIAFTLLSPAAGRADPPPLPRHGSSPKAFVPRGWTIEETLEGDLDADGKPDAVLVLVQDAGPGVEERDRMLVVVLRRGDELVLGGSNGAGLLSAYEGAGPKGGTGEPELAVEKGVLLVKQLGGDAEMWNTLHRFRWNARRAAFELIGLDTGRMHAFTHAGSESSCNYLTRRCVDTRRTADQDDDGKLLDQKEKTVTRRLAQALPQTMEEVGPAL